MPTNPPTGPDLRNALLARWGRFVDSITPAHDADRLVHVAEVGRGALPLAEGSLADLSVPAVIQETRSLKGESRFAVLVPARDADAAREALAGL
jgi:hypothetical protein